MLSKTSTKQHKYILTIYTKHKMEIAKQNAKQRYYQKNKEKYIERVRKQREDKRTTQNNSPPIQNNASLIQNTINLVDFISWNKYMTYICVDIRDL
jgi:hypothetical protein